MFEIETSSRFITVASTYRNARLDEAAQRLGGKWWGKDHHYSYPIGAAHEIRALVAELTVPQTTLQTPTAEPAAEPATTPRTGWSKASRSRRTHPLGTPVENGDGYTIYEDTTFGGGRVQIWDKS